MADGDQRWIAKRQADVAVVYAVSLDTVKSWAKQGMPGEPGAYELPAISAWLRGKGPWRQHAKIESDDPLLSDGDSPGLERYRLAKAELAELELAERKKSLIERGKVRIVFSRLAAVLKRMGEEIGIEFGDRAAVAVREAMGECREAARHGFGEDGV